MTTANATSDFCSQEFASECEFSQKSCLQGNKEVRVVDCCSKNRPLPCEYDLQCTYRYGCYIQVAEGDVLTVVILLCFLYVLLLIYSIYLLRKDFFSKKRLIDKFDDITIIVCILLFASLFRGIVVILKKVSYESTGFFVIETLSEIFQVTGAFYFVYFGRQLTTKVIREKTFVIKFLGRIKRIILVIIFFLIVRLVCKIAKFTLGVTVIRGFFLMVYFCVFAFATKMILHSQSVMNKIKQDDDVISLIRFVNKIIFGVFVVFALWGMAYMIRTYFIRNN